MAETHTRSATGAVVAGIVVIASASVNLASFYYVFVGMQLEFSFSTDVANALAFMPAAASLLVVFAAGSLADRWGPRRLLVAAVALFTLGALIVCLSPNLTWVLVGRILDGIGAVTMSIVALAVISSAVTEPGKRARVFGVYAAISPATFLLAPGLAALVVQLAGWRAGLIPGAFLGAVALVPVLRYVPDQRGRATGELFTPLLAGLVLAGIALGVTSLPTSSAFSLTAVIVALVSVVALVVAMRRLPAPTLDLRWCRGRGMPLLLIATGATAMPSLIFYTNLLLQYRYLLPLFTIALLLMIPQACAVVGGLLSGPVSARIGAAKAATAALFVSAVASLSTLLVTPSAPIWVPVLALAVSVLPITFVFGPLTDTFMSQAPGDASGAASSMRKATSTLGGVLGGAAIGFVAFSAFQSRLAGILRADGLSFEEAQIIAQEIRDGAVVDDLAARILEPIARDDLIARGPGLLEAQSYAFAVMGVMSAALYLVAAVVMIAYLRRTRTVGTV